MNVLLAAVEFVKRGYFVLPLNGKIPYGTLVPHGYKDATRDLEKIKFWYNRAPSAGIGISVKPSGLCILDIDPRNGGNESFKELVKKYGEPTTPMCLTGGGGNHYYFSAHPNVTQKITGLFPGIDIIADGYAVAPPTLHPSGKRYAWSVDHHIEDIELTIMPDWLVYLCTNRKQKDISKTIHNPEWVNRIQTGVTEGLRNDTLVSLVGHLLRRHVEPYVALTLVHSWNKTMSQPPLSIGEVNKIVESIGRLEKQRRGQR